MMVVPYRHTASLSGWSPEEQQEMMQLADLWVDLLKKTMQPDGFNLGINMGLVGGAGVADHIHLHIVPRWNGDTNFMPVLSDNRVISEALRATYGKLKEALDELKSFSSATLPKKLLARAGGGKRAHVNLRERCRASQKGSCKTRFFFCSRGSLRPRGPKILQFRQNGLVSPRSEYVYDDNSQARACN